jgi:coenzyme F420-reducing hydrogenase alpha subunit
MLHLPDFMGYPDAITMAKDHKRWVERALQLKKLGNDIVNLLGGREIHPINAKVGGFYRYPTREELEPLKQRLQAALPLAKEAALFLKGLEFPAFNGNYELVALHHPDEYAMNEGRLKSSKGLEIPIQDYEAHFTEEHMAYSTTLHTLLDHQKIIYTGPLARFNLNYDQLSPQAKQLAEEINLLPGCMNPFKSILARMIETYYACEHAVEIIEAYQPPQGLNDEVLPTAGTGMAVTEAPRGILYHSYQLDETGIIKKARIVAPTSHNQRVIEEDLKKLVEKHQHQDDQTLTALCEQSIRNYDPCISCSTHFLNLKIERA